MRPRQDDYRRPTSNSVASFSTATTTPSIMGNARRFLNSNPVYKKIRIEHHRNLGKMISKSADHGLRVVKPQFSCYFGNSLNCNMQKKPGSTSLEKQRGGGGNPQGRCAAPFGSIDGTYRSMLPKVFFGTFPYYCYLRPSSPEGRLSLHQPQDQERRARSANTHRGLA